MEAVKVNNNQKRKGQTMNRQKRLTIHEWRELEKRASTFNRIVERAAQAWKRGNNSGSAETMKLCDAQCDKLRARAVALLPKNSKVSWPGLYPVIERNGSTCYCTANAETFA